MPYIDPITPAPKKVKIIKCSYPEGWYRNKIGQEFGVDNPANGKDYTVWLDMVERSTVWRHIAREDCEEVKTDQ